MTTTNSLDALDAFLLARAAQNVSSKTISWYEHLLGAYCRHCDETGEDWKSARTVERHLANLRACGRSSATINAVFRALRTFFRWLRDNGFVDEVATEKLVAPIVERHAPRAVLRSDVERLLDDVSSCDGWRDVRDRALVFFLYDTGIRAGELATLKLDDVNVDDRTATVFGKSKRARVVVFTTTTSAALADYLDVRPRDKGDHFFVGKRGALTSSGVYQITTRRGKRANVRGRCHPHAFRHALARDYLRNGGELVTLADQLGHASIETTREHYAIFVVSERRDMHDKASPVLTLDVAI